MDPLQEMKEQIEKNLTHMRNDSIRFAAICLRVEHTSLDPDINAMIRAANRREAAVQITIGLVGCQDFVNECAQLSESKQSVREQIAAWARLQADALLAELGKGAGDG